jgi:hypothetical protein
MYCFIFAGLDRAGIIRDLPVFLFFRTGIFFPAVTPEIAKIRFLLTRRGNSRATRWLWHASFCLACRASCFGFVHLVFKRDLIDAGKFFLAITLQDG